MPGPRGRRARGPFLGGLVVCRGNPGGVIEATHRVAKSGQPAALAIVLETEGSTYAPTGALALFTTEGHHGWLSGGCLEADINEQAREAAETGQMRWMEIDTRADETLLSGSATGCRGRLRLVLLPINPMVGLACVLSSWLQGGRVLRLSVTSGGSVEMSTTEAASTWRLATATLPWVGQQSSWLNYILRPPETLVLGAGPETQVLIPLLRDLGWRTTCVDRRASWRATKPPTLNILDRTPTQAIEAAVQADAVLVMHHNFEMDLEALVALAAAPAAFVGLLGPERRRDDLFKLMPMPQKKNLLKRLRSPVGMGLGGKGPEAIALSIAAQLEHWRNFGDA